jgi:hypothetical protein
MTIFALAGCLGETAVIGALVILLRLSAKLGDVQKWKPYYLGYYPAIALVGVALAARLLAASLWYDPTTPFTLWLHGSRLAHLHLGSLALGVTIALPITVKYWSWLLHES